MPFCVRCGKEVPGDGAFCPSCGSPVPRGAAPSLRAGDGPPPPAGATARPTTEEWRAFLGPNADFYLARFPSFTTGNVDSFALTWNWPVFLCFCFPFLWFLYRKLYLPAVASLLVWAVPGLNLLAWLAIPAAANYLYYLDGRKRILALRAANGGVAPPEALASLGGVNRWVWAAAVVAALLALAGIVSGLLLAGAFLCPAGASA